MCGGAGVEVADDKEYVMELRSIVKSSLAFFSGATVIPIAAVSFVPIDFVKGYLHVPFWEGIVILAFALAVISLVSAALYLVCLELGKTVPHIRVSICVGLFSTVLAFVISSQSGNILFFFLVHFGCAIGAGLLLPGQERHPA